MGSLNKKFPRLLPGAVKKGINVADLIDTTFKAYNGGRLAEACRTVGLRVPPSGSPHSNVTWVPGVA